MLSMSAGMSAGAAGSYFGKEDYYLQRGDAASEWLGRGAQDLGLGGQVDKESFAQVLAGRDPETGEQLVAGKIEQEKDKGGNLVFNEDGSPRMIDKHRAGNDLTFSAPKSVSIAYAAGVDGIKAAHDSAVKAVVEHIEKYNSNYRDPEGVKRSDNLVAAKFDHATSRAIDPQLHSHVFIANMTKDQDGNWKANEPKNIFKDQKALGALYRQELVHELQKQGHEITFTDREQNLFELKSVDKSVIDTFSTRRAAIDARLEQWKQDGTYKEFENKGMTKAQISEMACLGTRKPKDTGLTREDVQQAWDKGFTAAGVTKNEVKDHIESQRKEALVEKASKSVGDVVTQAATFLSDKEAVIDRAKLVETATKISGGEHDIKSLNAEIDKQTVILGDAKGREYVSTPEMLNLEKANITRAAGMADTFKSVTSREEVENFLVTLKSNENISLSDGQKNMMINELTGGHGVNVSQGDPGTGKTFVLEMIQRFNNEVLLPSNREHVVHNVGFTGRAAAEMEAATGQKSNTIDSFLNKVNKGEILVGAQKEGVQRQEVIRIDEASFVGAKQTDSLLRLAETAKDAGATMKVSFQGDTKQRQSISAGRVLGQLSELAKTGKADSTELKEIQRQSKESGLQPVASELNRTDIKASERGVNALNMLEGQGRVHEIDATTIKDAAAAIYIQKMSEQHPDASKEAKGVRPTSIIATSTNKDVQAINATVRDMRVSAGEIEQGNKFTVFTAAQSGLMASNYEVGQKILFGGTRGADDHMHSWKAPLGTTGQITGINKEENTVTVQYEKTDHRNAKIEKIEKTLDAAEMAGKVSVYNQQERNFAAGDRVMNLMNQKLEAADGKKQAEIKNGDIGVIKAIDEKGVATISYNPGERSERTVKQDLNQAHIDHAYAATVDKLQGATVDNIIIHADIAADKMSMSYQAINVAGTRARHDAQIVTNDVQGLKESVMKIDEKTSTLDWHINAVDPGVQEKIDKAAVIATVAHEAGVVSRENAIADKAAGHQAEAAKLFSEAHERSGNRADGTPWELVGDNNPGSNFSLNHGKNGFEIRYGSTVKGGTSDRRTETIYGDHGKTEKVTTTRGDALSRTSETSGTVKSKIGDSRENVKFNERSTELFGGFYRSTTRVERTSEAVKTTKSTTFGNSVKGTTTTIFKNGRVIETAWEGKKNGKELQIISSTTKTYRDENKALMATGSLFDKSVRATVMTALKIANNETYKEIRAEQTGGGYLKVTEQKYMKDGTVEGRTQQFAGNEIRKDVSWQKDKAGNFEITDSKITPAKLDVNQGAEKDQAKAEDLRGKMDKADEAVKKEVGTPGDQSKTVEDAPKAPEMTQEAAGQGGTMADMDKALETSLETSKEPTSDAKLDTPQVQDLDLAGDKTAGENKDKGESLADSVAHFALEVMTGDIARAGAEIADNLGNSLSEAVDALGKELAGGAEIQEQQQQQEIQEEQDFGIVFGD